MPFQQRPAESNPALEPLLPQQQPKPETSREAPAAGNIKEAEAKADAENLPASYSLINDSIELRMVSKEHEPVENTAQNLPDEPPAPLKKPRLKELIKLFAEAIREYDLGEDVELGVGKNSSQDGRQSSNTDKDISEIWRDVKPMNLDTVSLDPQAQLEFNQQYSSVDDVYNLFILKVYPNDGSSPRRPTKETDWVEVHACVVRWRISELQKAGRCLWQQLENPYSTEILGTLQQGQIQKWDPVTDLRVMICCCLAAGEGQNQIGHILKHCYRLGVLVQPLETSTMEYMYQVSIIFSGLFILNDISHKGPPTVEWMSFNTYVGDILHVLDTIDDIQLDITLPQVFGLTMESLFAMFPSGSRLYSTFHEDCFYHEEPQGEPRMDDLSQPIFRVDDLNVYSLQEIGKLKIRWTEYVDRHLLLNVRQSVLWVCWKKFPVKRNSMIERLYDIFVQSSAFIPRDQYSLLRLNTEMVATQGILFASKDSLEKRVLAYSRIEQPAWGSEVAVDFHQNWYCKWESIRERYAGKSQFRYREFPVFKHRLRQLRHYMDTQKPRTFRQMWKDKRDTSNYFTFWAVMIFGGLGVLLAFLSLVVSIAQTVASFKPLNLPAQPGPSN